MVDKVILHRDDLVRLIQIIDLTNPTSGMITITSDTSSGIGAIIDAEVTLSVRGCDGAFKVNIANESDW